LPKSGAQSPRTNQIIYSITGARVDIRVHFMAGHNKWSKVKRIKGAIDAKRGKLFSKLAKEIAVAAKLGGPDPDANVRLRSAIALARTQNMPNDNIKRAIKRGSGDTGEAALEEVMYEGYAAEGVALLIEAATDNRNRTAADVRLIFSKNGGHLGGAGSVAHLFSRKGEITVPEGASDPDRLLELALEAEADELTSEPGQPHVVTTAPDRLAAVAEALRSASVPVESQKLVFVPHTTVTVTDEQAAVQVLRLHDALDDNDDVLNVYSNFELPAEVLERISGHN
jgi:YebC/PmpR family DNA-binding regulatory protein